MNRTPDSNELRPHLLVQAGEVTCALPLEAVRRVVKALPVHRLPGAASELSGLAEFAGEPLPVLDLALLVGAAPGPSPAYPVTVICWAGAGGGGGEVRELLGLAADAAVEVVPLDPAAVVAVEGGFTAGEVRVGEQVVRVLDLVALAERDGGRAA